VNQRASYIEQRISRATKVLAMAATCGPHHQVLQLPTQFNTNRLLVLKRKRKGRKVRIFQADNKEEPTTVVQKLHSPSEVRCIFHKMNSNDILKSK
jgi:hypothetical protein